MKIVIGKVQVLTFVRDLYQKGKLQQTFQVLKSWSASPSPSQICYWLRATASHMETLKLQMIDKF